MNQKEQITKVTMDMLSNPDNSKLCSYQKKHKKDLIKLVEANSISNFYNILDIILDVISEEEKELIYNRISNLE